MKQSCITTLTVRSSPFLNWLGAFPIDVDLTHQLPGVYSLEIIAIDIFNLSDRSVISYTSG